MRVDFVKLQVLGIKEIFNKITSQRYENLKKILNYVQYLKSRIFNIHFSYMSATQKCTQHVSQNSRRICRQSLYRNKSQSCDIHQPDTSSADVAYLLGKFDGNANVCRFNQHSP